MIPIHNFSDMFYAISWHFVFKVRIEVYNMQMWCAEVINDLLVHRNQKFLRLHLANNKHAKHIFGEFRNVSIILLAHRLLRKTDWWLTKKGWNTRQQIHFRLTWANTQNPFLECFGNPWKYLSFLFLKNILNAITSFQNILISKK